MSDIDASPAEHTALHQESLPNAVLTDESAARAPRRSWWVPAAVAAAVVALVAGVAVTALHRGRPDQTAGADGSVSVVVRPLTASEIATEKAKCLRGQSFPASSEVAYAVQYLDRIRGVGSTLILVDRGADSEVGSGATAAPRQGAVSAAGRLLTCENAYSSSGSLGPAPAPVVSTPTSVVRIGGSYGALGSGPGNPNGFGSIDWFACGTDIKLIRKRIVVDGDAGPWFYTVPMDGYAVVTARRETEPSVAHASLETEVIAGDGTSVSIPGVTDPETVSDVSSGVIMTTAPG